MEQTHLQTRRLALLPMYWQASGDCIRRPWSRTHVTLAQQNAQPQDLSGAVVQTIQSVTFDSSQPLVEPQDHASGRMDQHQPLDEAQVAVRAARRFPQTGLARAISRNPMAMTTTGLAVNRWAVAVAILLDHAQMRRSKEEICPRSRLDAQRWPSP